MTEMKSSSVVATLIGDVVGSRRADDRAGLHDRLSQALDEANRRFPATEPLRITVGDEYQGSYATLGEALAVSFRLRLALLPEVDVRQGLGWGSVTTLSTDPVVGDGPGWWAARAAIDAVKQEATVAGRRSSRSAYVRDPETSGPDDSVVDAALMCRDQMVAWLGARSLGLLRGLVEGATQVELAAREEISASAVSQTVRRDGLATILAAQRLLERTR